MGQQDSHHGRSVADNPVDCTRTARWGHDTKQNARGGPNNFVLLAMVVIPALTMWLPHATGC